jgi:predicted XRE-type DNA-binding protein
LQDGDKYDNIKRMRNTRPISWIKAARRDFEEFPEEVRDNMLSALTIAAESSKSDKAKPMNDDFELIRGSGNVFRDFGHRNASVEKARAILAAEIIRTLDERGLSTREAEKLTGVSHSEFSRIRNARLERFTLDRMITILGKLDEDVEVSVTFRSRNVLQDGLPA